MRINVFLRSTLRQPVRTVLLLLVTAALTFVFVSSGTQYLLIDQETENLGSYYRSIGTLTTGVAQTDQFVDVSEAAAWLEESPYVEMVDRVWSLSAVADIQNIDNDKTDTAYMSSDLYFYGTLTASDGSRILGYDNNEYCEYNFWFDVDTVLAGYEEFLWEGARVKLMSPSGVMTSDYRVATPYGTETKWAEGDPYVDLTSVYEELEVGGRYLLHAVYDPASDSWQHLYSLNDGGQYAAFNIRPLTGDVWYYPVTGEGVDFSDPALAGVAEDISRVNDNQHALLFFGSEDVSSMPGTQKDPGTAPVLVNTVLSAGRWPDAQDNAEGNRVCAIHSKLAAARGLTVGDTLTVTFRELLDMSAAPYLCMPEDLSREGGTPVSEAETYEIVGIFETMTGDQYYYSFLYNYVYVPAASLPQALVSEPEILTPYYLSFTLTSPEVEDQFIVETREAFSALGFQARFLPTNYDSFRSAARPLRFSAMYNTLIFSMVLAVALCLVVFLYFRMRRKDVAIARALGLPVGQCVRQVSLPQLLIGLAGILAGGYAGWRYTLENAGQTLSTLSEIVEESGTAMAALSVGWLVLLLAACFALLLILTLGSAVLTARKPVLFQLQGGTTVKQT